MGAALTVEELIVADAPLSAIVKQTLNFWGEKAAAVKNMHCMLGPFYTDLNKREPSPDEVKSAFDTLEADGAVTTFTDRYDGEVVTVWKLAE